MDAGQLVPKGKKYPTVWLPDKPVRPRSKTSSSRPKAPVGLAKALKKIFAQERHVDDVSRPIRSSITQRWRALLQSAPRQWLTFWQ